MEEPYLYNGLEAELYDQLDELSGFEDLEFYKWLANANGPNTLDIGCGTGRVLIPLAQSGQAVTGLEFSSEMREICRQRVAEENLSAEVVSGDMRSFNFDGNRFSSVMVPGYSIQLLLEDEEVTSCLQCCRNHLADGGQLVLPTYMPWDLIWENRNSKPIEERSSAVNEFTGEVVTAYQGWELDNVAQRLRLLNRYEKVAADGAILEEEEKSMTLRWYAPHEMLKLIEDAGFGDVSTYGDFSLDEATDGSESIIYVARI